MGKSVSNAAGVNAFVATCRSSWGVVVKVCTTPLTVTWMPATLISTFVNSARPFGRSRLMSCMLVSLGSAVGVSAMMPSRSTASARERWAPMRRLLAMLPSTMISPSTCPWTSGKVRPRYGVSLSRRISVIWSRSSIGTLSSPRLSGMGPTLPRKRTLRRPSVSMVAVMSMGIGVPSATSRSCSCTSLAAVTIACPGTIRRSMKVIDMFCNVTSATRSPARGVVPG